MLKKLILRSGTLFLIAMVLGTCAFADNFSFTGNFTQDDNVQLFTFTVGAASTITLRSWSYAGGINAAGTVIARGGFDPILALFNSTGALVGQNDDGGGLVAADITFAHYDTFFSALVGPGSYTASVMQYDNFALGPNLSNGFRRDGQGNFTGPLTGHAGGSFWDVSGSAFAHRDNHWAFDILNVESATEVPEPSAIILLGTVVLGLGTILRRRAKA